MKKAIYEELKNQLIAKGLADNGCVATGIVYNIGWYTFFGALGGLMVTERGEGELLFCKRGDQLLIIPYKKKQMLINEGIAIKKDNIVKTKMFGARFTFKTVDKKKRGYSISKGAKDLKQILLDLGLKK